MSLIFPAQKGSDSMMEGDIEHCARRIAEEERLGGEAPSLEAGLVHFQLAMLYKTQLAVLARRASSPAS
jgi:hypothetical protein